MHIHKKRGTPHGAYPTQILPGGLHISTSADLSRDCELSFARRKGVTFLKESYQRTFLLSYSADSILPFQQTSPAIAHCALRIAHCLTVVDSLPHGKFCTNPLLTLLCLPIPQPLSLSQALLCRR